jgi:hypothetical protein
MRLLGVLSGQGWTEIAVMLADNRDHPFAESIAITPVARLAALAGHEAGSTVGVQSTEQSIDLAPADTK